ncbi:MAG: hypothetical protein J4F43_11645 [Dehalococcoidia bacterium]|nr:hypothetical protein [Dehalococcoidia bacterium]
MSNAATGWERERLLEALDAHRRGLSYAPQVQKLAHSVEPAPDDGKMTFVVSTDDVDRQGDTIAVDGWMLDSYLRNPVFLWAHNYARPAIGRAAQIWREPHRLLARIEFAPTDFAQEVRRLYHAGYQHGVSVGFRPIRYALRRDPQSGQLQGIDFLEQELLEISASPVPANAQALRKSLGDKPILSALLDGLDTSRHEAAETPQDLSIDDLLAVLRGASG